MVIDTSRGGHVVYELIGADGAPYLSKVKGPVGGNARARIYGRLDCPSALAALRRSGTYARHRVFFASEEDAVSAGFRPCGTCMRSEYREWRAAGGASR